MIATQNQELVDIFNRVKDWPLDMRITLARQHSGNGRDAAHRRTSPDAIARSSHRHPENGRSSPDG